MQRINKGDEVQIIRGAERPQTAEDRKKPSGTVTSVDTVAGTCIVAGKNLVWRHKKGAGPEEPGGRTQQEAPIQLSNVMLFNKEKGRAERVGFKVVGGKKVRVFKKSGSPVGKGE
jgi:large subunit ribosomal protein L24